MTLLELLVLTRNQLDDVVQPYRVSDATIVKALADAQAEFAKTTYSNYASGSATVTASDPWIDIPAAIIKVRAVIIAGVQVRPVNSYEMDFGFFSPTAGVASTESRFTGWREETGTPKFAVEDMGPDKLRLYPTPSSSGTATVEGYGLPATLSLTGPVDPTIPKQFHEDLHVGALHRIYSMEDVEIGDQQQAVKYFQLWTQAIKDAQVALNTALRTQIRVMRLPRSFAHNVVAAPVTGDNNGQPASDKAR